MKACSRNCRVKLILDIHVGVNNYASKIQTIAVNKIAEYGIKAMAITSTILDIPKRLQN